MASPTRRSARLGGNDIAKQNMPTSTKLSSLIERVETPTSVQSRLNAIAATPMAPPSTPYSGLKTPAGVQSRFNAISTTPMAPPNTPMLKTPTTASRMYPSLGGMHPSKIQKSTAKKPDSGLNFGFVGVEAVKDKCQATPTKSAGEKALPIPVESPAFEFRFTRAQPDLGPEAQKMMDDLRGEAALIKERLKAEWDAEKAKGNGEAVTELIGVGGRKIARAKGRSGRYSDVHMAEFRKMDSIAGHPSAFRAQPGRFTPVAASLKRSKSKANLDDTEEAAVQPVKSAPASTSLKRSKSQAKLDDPDEGRYKTELIKSCEDVGDRLANSSPAKRIKTHANEDTSHKAKATTGDSITTPTSNVPHSQSCVSTPTQASLARAANVKRLDSKIPSLVRSPSTGRSLTSARNLKYISSLAKMKSVFRGQHAAPNQSSQHIPRLPQSISASCVKANVNKDLPSLPSTPTPGLKRSPTLKRVTFTSDTKSSIELSSPSPVRSYQAQSRLPVGPNAPVHYPILYPNLPKLPPPTSIKASEPQDAAVFSFRSDKNLLFGSGTGASTIRKVRPSVATPTETLVSPVNAMPVLGVPHGIPNEKKRRRDDNSSDDDRAREPANKKIRGAIQWTPELHQKNKEEAKADSRVSRPIKNLKARGKGVLSLSRLNVLASPKRRMDREESVVGSGKGAKGTWTT